VLFTNKSFQMMTAKDIYQKALALKPQEQAELVDKLIAHLDFPDKTIDELWQKESESRIEAYEKGLIKSLSLGEVLEKYKNL
jgi:putative addiction module component (TIGR02574 family)